MNYYLSFDIGGTQIKYAVLTQQGDIIEQSKLDTPKSGDAIVEEIVKVKTQLSDQYPLQGAAFSMPGFVNVETGVLHTSGAINDFYEINFKQLMIEKLNLPVELENDVNCVALAEKWLGNAQHSDNFICITIGTGVGGAICLNGEVVRGHRYMAGEFGYMLTRDVFKAEDKTRTNMSFTASVRQGLRHNYCAMKGKQVSAVSGLDVYLLAEQGDVLAKQVINEFYECIAIGLYNLTFILNPEKILIGGAISDRDEIFPAIKKKFQHILDVTPSPDSFMVADFVTIGGTHFKNDSGLIGALYHFLQMRK